METVFDFPVVGNDGKPWGVPRLRYESHRGTFPALDVMAEYRKAAEWISANPRRRKTARGMPGFLFSWLERAQNRPGPRSIPDQRCAFHRAYGTLGKKPPSGWIADCPECKHARAGSAGRTSEVVSASDLAEQTARRLAAQKPPAPWTPEERAEAAALVRGGRG